MKIDSSGLSFPHFLSLCHPHLSVFRRSVYPNPTSSPKRHNDLVGCQSSGTGKGEVGERGEGGEKGSHVARRVFRSLLDKRMCQYNVVAADKSLKSCLWSTDKEPPLLLHPPPPTPVHTHTDTHTYPCTSTPTCMYAHKQGAGLVSPRLWKELGCSSMCCMCHCTDITLQ